MQERQGEHGHSGVTCDVTRQTVTMAHAQIAVSQLRRWRAAAFSADSAVIGCEVAMRLIK